MNNKVPLKLTVNGGTFDIEVEPRWLLSDVLRHQLGLVGTHVGCEQGACGACTVLIDGKPERSCLTFAIQVEGQQITTVEGLTQDENLTPLQEAFSEHHALQCGYCTPGMLLTATALLQQDPHPSELKVREAISGNVCRCTGYQFIVDAILAASGNAKEDQR
ncbi:MAG: (2Fe-2S)-binding protein [Sulfobacillus benefaciens]|uniref:(2Fe-2S)-binding protein n=1 Tax=Sulfobacillus benefaciens TaxID=453960 RepID=A0A2T2XLD4_9FIRM|nr:MAG: (2Fe-2S)-binding protein [Sulfobacillus benefaciens]